MTGFSVAILPGAGGGAPDLSAFVASEADLGRLLVVRYPGWARYALADFGPDALVRELAQDIAARAPSDPIGVVGVSLGGHLGYAVALRLRTMGRRVAGFCAIDSFMISTAAAKPGWRARYAAQASGYLRERDLSRLWLLARSLLARLLMRLMGAQALSLLRRHAVARWLGAALARSPTFEMELSMRLLLRAIAPWLAGLDRDPAPLPIPAALLRTQITAGDDSKWNRRCPNLEIIEIPGDHDSLFDTRNIDVLRAAFLHASRDWR